jgi:CheY-like chemotaxis protein
MILALSVEEFKRSMTRKFDPPPPPSAPLPISPIHLQAGFRKETPKKSNLPLLSPEEKENITRNKVILVVDDAVEYLQVLTKILDYRYTLILVKSGEDAIRALRRKAVDLILLDIEMPGISGLDLSTILKSDPVYQTIPVIFVTSYSQSDIITKAIELGAKGYIIKPLKDHQTLLSKIDQVLKSSPGKMAVIELSRQLIKIEKYLVEIQKVRETEKDDPFKAFEETENLYQEALTIFSGMLEEKDKYSASIDAHLNRIYTLLKNKDNHILLRVKELIDGLGVRDLAIDFVKPA